jgi:DNA polymerase III epsilon subunit-like protein
MMERLWMNCKASDSFPFGRRIIDTQQLDILLDIVMGTKCDSYSQSALLKKYGLKNEKTHTAAADVLANKQLFEKQLANLKKLIER